MAENMTISADRRGEEALLTLIYPITEESMSEAQKKEFAAAAAEQLEFMNSSGRDIVRETIGDVSVTYSDNDRDCMLVCGVGIAPCAYARLLRCGLLGRWV